MEKTQPCLVSNVDFGTVGTMPRGQTSHTLKVM